jgi:hypothetical protein
MDPGLRRDDIALVLPGKISAKLKSSNNESRYELIYLHALTQTRD